jgi:hypothetical protein
MYHHLSHDIRLVFVPFSMWGLYELLSYVTEELSAFIFRVYILGLDAGSKFLPNVRRP